MALVTDIVSLDAPGGGKHLFPAEPALHRNGFLQVFQRCPADQAFFIHKITLLFLQF